MTNMISNHKLEKIFPRKLIIERGVIIGNNVTIRDFSVIKKGSVIGNDTYIGYGNIIGSEGFQDVKIDGINTVIPHVAGCKIGNDVSIFDNTCICNSLFEDTTVIGDHTKIDNLVHIAHNCIIGSNCTITAGTILCGKYYNRRQCLVSAKYKCLK